jgi:hypothetical protein
LVVERRNWIQQNDFVDLPSFAVMTEEFADFHEPHCWHIPDPQTVVPVWGHFGCSWWVVVRALLQPCLDLWSSVDQNMVDHEVQPSDFEEHLDIQVSPVVDCGTGQFDSGRDIPNYNLLGGYGSLVLVLHFDSQLEVLDLMTVI